MSETQIYKDFIKDPVKEVQFYLKEISKYHPEIPIVYPDGIYNSKTKEAVTEFQRIYELPTTGIVDLNTWNQIVKEYGNCYEITSAPNQISCFPHTEFNINLDDEDDLVYVIQFLLRKLNKKYKNYIEVNITGKYDQATIDAIKQFQTTNKLPVTGIVDKTTWNSLARINDTCRLYDI